MVSQPASNNMYLQKFDANVFSTLLVIILAKSPLLDYQQQQQKMAMKGYYGNPEATTNAFHEACFITGDVAYYDEEGYFNIADRLKKLIKY